MSAGYYRKKPTVIEAQRWTGQKIEGKGDGGPFSGLCFAEFHPSAGNERADVPSVPHLHTPSGIAPVRNGDWVARQKLPTGAWDYWPIGHDVFAATYEEV